MPVHGGLVEGNRHVTRRRRRVLVPPKRIILVLIGLPMAVYRPARRVAAWAAAWT
jgi:type II secretory pathway component PulL